MLAMVLSYQNSVVSISFHPHPEFNFFFFSPRSLKDAVVILTLTGSLLNLNMILYTCTVAQR